MADPDDEASPLADCELEVVSVDEIESEAVEVPVDEASGGADVVKDELADPEDVPMVVDVDWLEEDGEADSTELVAEAESDVAVPDELASDVDKALPEEEPEALSLLM